MRLNETNKERKAITLTMGRQVLKGRRRHHNMGKEVSVHDMESSFISLLTPFAFPVCQIKLRKNTL